MEQTEHGGGEGSAIERRGDPTVADGHGRVVARTRFGSHKRRLRRRTWSTLPGRPLGRSQHLIRARIKMDPIVRRATDECELT